MSLAADWTVPSRLCDVARPQQGFAHRIAVSDGTRRLTYAELDRRIDAMREDYAERGLAPGDRIALLLPSSIVFVIAYLAAHRAGLVVIPLNPLLGPQEIGFILTTMCPALVVADDGVEPLPAIAELERMAAGPEAGMEILRVGIDSLSPADPAGTPDTRASVSRHADDEALILFTSGTSGRPKGASHREGALIANIQHSNAAFGIRPTDIVLCPLPLSHVFGQVVMMMGSLMAGAELALVPRPSPDAVFQAMLGRGPSILGAVPTTFAGLVERGRGRLDIAKVVARNLRFALAGGAPLPAVTAKMFEGMFGIGVHQGYGMTEIACCIAIEGPGARPSGGVGRICAPLDHRIVPIGDAPDEGELEVAGPNLMRGYYVDGDLVPRPPEQWFATGDVVRRDTQGNIFIFDRKKEMIIRNGYNIYPSEVEAALASHPAVLHAAVIGIADDAVGQEIAAFVALRDGATATPSELAAWCRTRIALYKYPRLLAILPELPTNATGKILKRALDPAVLRRVNDR